MVYHSPMIWNEDLTNTLDAVRCWSYEGGVVRETEKEACTEEVVVIVLNNRPISTLVASPVQLRELGAGFVVSEGLAGEIQDVQVQGLTVQVTATERSGSLSSIIESCGGPTSGTLMSHVKSSLVIEQELIFTVISAIVSELWERTGGAHCSVLFSGGELVAKSSDIGRHNTVDKVIGHALLNGIDLSGCVLGCTGRQPSGMITKAANAGIPIVVSKAATTRQGAETAQRAGLTLVGRVKQDRFCVYSHPERIAGLVPGNSPYSGGSLTDPQG
ncbi:MAG: formate dehydrogenase accessory sulfurtransferase FdhD [Desulfomonilia bacterium]|jgi:FdhD protein